MIWCLLSGQMEHIILLKLFKLFQKVTRLGTNIICAFSKVDRKALKVQFEAILYLKI